MHEAVRRWIGAQGWTELRPIQAQAIEPVQGAEEDVILAAATAAGKTEAAFLPIVSRILEEPRASIQALYVSPLKALINDQHRRLDELGQAVGVDVHRWHGDVSQSAKARVLDQPTGILQITPESLEALFVLRASSVPRVLAHLGWVVVDELHTFLEGERGRHLQSLLHRIELALGRRVPRIGLSATLGDLELAADFLRPGEARRVILVADSGDGSEVRIALHGFRDAPPASGSESEPNPPASPASPAEQAIAEHLFAHLRGGHHLVFANRRKDVEILADTLRRLSEIARVPNEFRAHHGSLARELREEVEARLQSDQPATAICTSTLEMGIDVGELGSVAQVGAPPSVAALRQRLGRSGRRGQPSAIRLYVPELERSLARRPGDLLREELVQATAMLQLLLAGWCEDPPQTALHLSTLVHQVLAMIASAGEARADRLYDDLCRTGPFRNVDEATFARLLRAMGASELIAQMGHGALVIGPEGERAVGQYQFFAVFQTSAEHRIVHDSRTLGTLPVTSPLFAGGTLIFDGRRWRVLSVDDARRVVYVEPAGGAVPPVFGASGLRIHDHVRREMRALYASDDEPAYLDATARELLAEGRAVWRELGLDRRAALPDGDDSLLFPWCGDRALATILAGLRQRGLDVSREGSGVRARACTPERLLAEASALLEAPPDPVELAGSAKGRERERFDRFLGEPLLAREWASRELDPEGARAALERALALA